MSREKTLEEMQKEFLLSIHNLVDYWAKVEDKSITSIKDRLDGLAHSILTIIDGETLGLPAYSLVPVMAEGDKEYYISQGENYYPDDELIDIAGSLNDLYFNIGR